MEFPVVVEELPLWYSIGPLAWLTAHELGHALIDSLREAASQGLPKHDDATVFSSYYAVRNFSPTAITTAEASADPGNSRLSDTVSQTSP